DASATGSPSGTDLGTSPGGVDSPGPSPAGEVAGSARGSTSRSPPSSAGRAASGEAGGLATGPSARTNFPGPTRTQVAVDPLGSTVAAPFAFRPRPLPRRVFTATRAGSYTASRLGPALPSGPASA